MSYYELQSCFLTLKTLYGNNKFGNGIKNCIVSRLLNLIIYLVFQNISPYNLRFLCKIKKV